MQHYNYINLMLTLQRCKEILNQGKKKFNDEEIKQIRDFLYKCAELELENNKINKNEI
jgi:hypothetical protein